MRQDWRKIQTDYMRGGKSLRQIAVKYGVSQSAVFRRAARENWVELRNQKASKALTRAREEAAETEGRRLAAKMERLEELADMLTAQIEKALGDDKQLYRYMVGVGPGRQEEQTLKILDTKRAREMVDAMAALKQLFTPPEEGTERQEQPKLVIEVEEVPADGNQDPAESETV